MTLQLCLAPFVLAPRCPSIPLAVVGPPPRQESLLARLEEEDLKREPCCCCNFAAAANRFSRNSELQRDERLQSAVFLALLSRIQDGVNFCILSTSTRISLQDVDLLVSVPLLLAVMVCMIIGTQYVLGFYFVIGPLASGDFLH